MTAIVITVTSLGSPDLCETLAKVTTLFLAKPTMMRSMVHDTLPR